MPTSESGSKPPEGFAALWERTAWPLQPPAAGVTAAGRHSSGLPLVLDAIDARATTTVVLEIGAEYGGSTRRFLENPHTWVVSVDPWPDDYRVTAFPEIDEHHRRGNTVHDLFRTFCWDVRDRLAMVRDGSPQGILAVRDAGTPVDYVYIDGDHRYDAVMRDLTIADALFPGAVLCGDDWGMKSEREKYEGMRRPVRRAVTGWAAFHDVHVEADRNTWMIDKRRPFNLDRPPARFVAVNSLVHDIDVRTARMERVLDRPTLTRRLEQVAKRLVKR